MVTKSDEYIALALKRSSLQRAERQGQYGTTRAIRMHFAPRHLQRPVNIQIMQDSYTTYPRFPRNSGGDNDDVGTSKSLLEPIIGREVADDLSRSGNVGEVGCDSRSVDDIVKAQL